MTVPMDIVKFAPLQSFVSPTFWHKFNEIKLDFDRLSDKPKCIFGYYTNRCAKSCLLEVDYTAFNEDFAPPKFCFKAYGTLYNKNTIEDFKNCDKQALLKEEGYKLLEEFQNDRALEDPTRLARFFILSFADLKIHSYYYWFAFPSPLTHSLGQVQKCISDQANGNNEEFQKIEKAYKSLSTDCQLQTIFILNFNQNQSLHTTLKEFCANSNDLDEESLENIYICFMDNSEFEHSTWLMRIYSAFINYKCPSLLGKTIKFFPLRLSKDLSLSSSLLWHVKQTEKLIIDADTKFVGWELNKNQKPQPRMVSMRDSMDPTLLAESSINMNLKLMKWRLLPELNLDVIFETKCLLFGAGTLGCAVARMLLGWGFKHISFIDNGKVSFANPVRQYLYTHDDAVKGNCMKASTAAKHLKEINPSVISNGYVMQIPMPDHTIGESLREQTEKDLDKIKELIQQHDVIFLLTDSRESRWLPTLLAAAYGKIVINAALGFDSYLVQRHGSSKKPESSDSSSTLPIIDNLKCISGHELGCYFCNDVTAPGNSLKDRTLDQQCTVTRPGVSNIAASYAVEMLVALLQHPLKENAPAYYATTTAASHSATASIPEGILGIIPHSIRGMLSNLENILPATQKFQQCIACSDVIISNFKTFGNEFLFKAFETAKYLEDLTGISEYKELNNEIIDFNDSDLEMSDA